MVEDIVGCKWTLSVIDMIRTGVVRPGEMVRNQKGLSTKVLNQRLRKLMGYGLIEKKVHPVVPPHVEYRFSLSGKEFLKILSALQKFDAKFSK